MSYANHLRKCGISIPDPTRGPIVAAAFGDRLASPDPRIDDAIAAIRVGAATPRVVEAPSPATQEDVLDATNSFAEWARANKLRLGAMWSGIGEGAFAHGVMVRLRDADEERAADAALAIAQRHGVWTRVKTAPERWALVYFVTDPAATTVTAPNLDPLSQRPTSSVGAIHDLAAHGASTARWAIGEQGFVDHVGFLDDLARARARRAGMRVGEVPRVGLTPSESEPRGGNVKRHEFNRRIQEIRKSLRALEKEDKRIDKRVGTLSGNVDKLRERAVNPNVVAELERQIQDLTQQLQQIRDLGAQYQMLGAEVQAQRAQIEALQAMIDRRSEAPLDEVDPEEDVPETRQERRQRERAERRRERSMGDDWRAEAREPESMDDYYADAAVDAIEQFESTPLGNDPSGLGLPADPTTPNSDLLREAFEARRAGAGSFGGGGLAALPSVSGIYVGSITHAMRPKVGMGPGTLSQPGGGGMVPVPGTGNSGPGWGPGVPGAGHWGWPRGQYGYAGPDPFLQQQLAMLMFMNLAAARQRERERNAGYIVTVLDDEDDADVSGFGPAKVTPLFDVSAEYRGAGRRWRQVTAPAPLDPDAAEHFVEMVDDENPDFDMLDFGETVESAWPIGNPIDVPRPPALQTRMRWMEYPG